MAVENSKTRKNGFALHRKRRFSGGKRRKRRRRHGRNQVLCRQNVAGRQARSDQRSDPMLEPTQNTRLLRHGPDRDQASHEEDRRRVDVGRDGGAVLPSGGVRALRQLSRSSPQHRRHQEGPVPAVGLRLHLSGFEVQGNESSLRRKTCRLLRF